MSDTEDLAPTMSVTAGEENTDSGKMSQIDISEAVSANDQEPQTPKSEVEATTNTAVSEDETWPSRKFITRAEVSGSAPSATNASLLLEARQHEISITFDKLDALAQTAVNSGSESIRKTFNDIKATIGHMPPELLGGKPIDWDFWGKVVDNYDLVVTSDPELLGKAIAEGIPKEFRGIIWQLVARSKSLQLEELYMHLKNETSAHERAIKRDLTRTSFFTNVEAINKADELYNVIKAYSLFDPDVGYTQGMAFIAVPLIMNMTESECFCLLVTLMKEYHLRELFCPDMQGLHLLLHQFDGLLEQKLARLYNHLIRQGISLSMYASQWFLTFFSYKFPLDVVLRIFDIVITEGMEALLRFAVNLMVRNENSLLLLQFDGLLDFLKLKLFNIYVSDDYLSKPKENRRFSLMGGTRSPSQSSDYYKLDAFVQDAIAVEILPSDLQRFKAEFENMCSQDAACLKEIETYKVQNGELRHELKGLETDLYNLNLDHMGVVQELVDIKVLLPEILGDIDELQDTVADFEEKISGLENRLQSKPESIPEDIESQIQNLLAENALETERYAELEEKLNQLTLTRDQLAGEVKSKDRKWFWK